MKQITCDIEVEHGQKLRLPKPIVDRVGPGQWRVTITPVGETEKVRGHSAFLNGYVPEDGLYDDYPAG